MTAAEPPGSVTRSSSPYHVEHDVCAGPDAHLGIHVFARSARSSLPVVAAEALVVDVTPEVDVVLRVRDGNLLTGPVAVSGTALHVYFAVAVAVVDVEPLDVDEDARGVAGHAAHSGDVAVPRLQ
jgi:hypothetical protein